MQSTHKRLEDRFLGREWRNHLHWSFQGDIGASIWSTRHFFATNVDSDRLGPLRTSALGDSTPPMDYGNRFSLSISISPSIQSSSVSPSEKLILRTYVYIYARTTYWVTVLLNSTTPERFARQSFGNGKWTCGCVCDDLISGGVISNIKINLTGYFIRDSNLCNTRTTKE